MLLGIHFKVHIDEENHENCFSSSDDETTEFFYCDIDNTNRLGDKDIPSSSLSDKWILIELIYTTEMSVQSFILIHETLFKFILHIVSG